VFDDEDDLMRLHTSYHQQQEAPSCCGFTPPPMRHQTVGSTDGTFYAFCSYLLLCCCRAMR
jgi:hypothetical protein